MNNAIICLGGWGGYLPRPKMVANILEYRNFMQANWKAQHAPKVP